MLFHTNFAVVERRVRDQGVGRFARDLVDKRDRLAGPDDRFVNGLQSGAVIAGILLIIPGIGNVGTGVVASAAGLIGLSSHISYRGCAFPGGRSRRATLHMTGGPWCGTQSQSLGINFLRSESNGKLPGLVKKNSNPVSLVLLVISIILFVVGMVQSSQGSYESSSSLFQVSSSIALISIGLTFLVNEIRARRDKNKP